jgi:hypothetical protein
MFFSRCCLLLALVFVSVWARDITLREEVEQTLDGFLRMLRSRISRIPLDTVYTTRGVQGLLAGVHHQLYSYSKYISEIGTQSVKLNSPDYYKQFKSLTKYNGDLTYNLKVPLPSPLHVNAEPINTFNEDKNDLCHEEAIHCVVTQECLSEELHMNAKKYKLTHQILYFKELLACNNLEDSFRNKYARVTAQMVSKMLEEQHHEHILTDLYAERIMIAILVGYHDHVLNDDDLIRWILEQKLEKHDGICWAASTQYSNVLRDNSSGDECGFHKSGLISYILAAYLRYT